MAVLTRYNWIFGLITIFFCLSAFGNGANDVANSYSTSIAARTLTMYEVGFLCSITEFVGAAALGAQVMQTIRNDIIGIDRFADDPGVLMMGMACAEMGSAVWLLIATHWGFRSPYPSPPVPPPSKGCTRTALVVIGLTYGIAVSTTQTIVGALVGVGLASGAQVSWAWTDGSVSQIAASWAVSPLIAAVFAATIFASIKYLVLTRNAPLQQGLRLIPVYQAFTGGVLTLFIVIEAPTAPSLEAFGVGKAVGIIVGVFALILAIAYVFFQPYFYRRLMMNDCRLEWYHIPLGPTLWREDPYVYYPSKKQIAVIDYYRNAYRDDDEWTLSRDMELASLNTSYAPQTATSPNLKFVHKRRAPISPRQRFLEPTAHLPLYDPMRIWSFIKFGLLHGITTDCVSHNLPHLERVHARAVRYQNKVEHLWTYAQVASAMLMSVAHGSNDVANAVGPWSAAYSTWHSGRVSENVTTPVWILAAAGALFGTGFWFFGYHIIRSLGNRVTQHSPTRGFSMEMGAAITVLMASRLGLPVSTTQCLTGAVLGVSLMNFNISATNWRQLAYIVFGWILTLPSAGLIAGLLMLMALNAPHFSNSKGRVST